MASQQEQCWEFLTQDELLEKVIQVISTDADLYAKYTRILGAVTRSGAENSRDFEEKNPQYVQELMDLIQEIFDRQNQFQIATPY